MRPGLPPRPWRCTRCPSSFTDARAAREHARDAHPVEEQCRDATTDERERRVRS